jgi:hypothetical protein
MNTALVTVYRIEYIDTQNKHSYGCFTADVYHDHLSAVCGQYRRTFRGAPKTPKEEGLTFFHGMLCGAVDKDMLQRWLPKRRLLVAFLDAGFKINAYCVPFNKLQVSRTQCVWHPNNATFVETIGNWETTPNENDALIMLA